MSYLVRYARFGAEQGKEPHFGVLAELDGVIAYLFVRPRVDEDIGARVGDTLSEDKRAGLQTRVGEAGFGREFVVIFYRLFDGCIFFFPARVGRIENIK